MSGINTFDRVKTYCVRAIENPSKETFVDLENVISSNLKQSDIDSLPPFQEYVAFPMKIVLLQNSKFSESTCISALKTLNTLLRLTSVSNWEFFSKTFGLLFSMLSNPECQINENKFSDELKLEILKSSQILVYKVTYDVKCQMMNSSFCPALGHAIFVLLWISQNEKSRQLRIVAMEQTLALFKFKDPDKTLECLTGKRLAAFLPGICIAMKEVANGDTKQGTAVTMSALAAFNFVITLVLSDKNLHDSNDQIDSCEQMEIKVPEVNRTEQWVNDTGSKLAILMEKMAILVNHDKFKVRLALLEWSENILMNCTSSLGKHLHIPLDVVIALNLDEHPEVSLKSAEILSKFNDLFSKLHKTDLLTKLEESIFALCTKLPRVFRVFDDIEKKGTLNLLAGYITLLGSKINCVLYSSSYLDRLMLSLLQLVQLDTSQVFILDNKLPSQSETITPESLSTKNLIWPKKYFKHFRDDKVLSTFCNVCQLLGSAGDTLLLVDYLLEKSRNSSTYRKESILILNELILGQSLTEKSLLDIDLLKYVTDEYLSNDFWNIEIVEIESSKENTFNKFLLENKSSSPETIRSNILQKCLIIEGFAKFSKVLKKDFEPLLLPILCPLLEQVASLSLPVSHSSSLALDVISQSCEYRSTSALIFENSDYLAHSLSLKLLHFEDFPEAPVVLDIVFRLSEAAILPLLQDLLLKVLQLLDFHHNEKGALLLRVLQSTLAAISRWNPVSNKTCKLKKPSQSNDLDGLNLRDYLVEYHRLHKIADDLDSDAISNELPQEEPREEENSYDKIRPLHIEMTINVLKRCVHMQSSQSLPIRILTQDLIQNGVRILKEFEDDLLPMVHQLWDPLVRRFTNDDHVVTLKAFETLLVLAELSGDFIRKRTLTDVWSKLISILEQQRSISRNKDDGTAYRFTIHYKLQLKILTNLGKLVQLLDIRENELESICALAIGYLTEKQPQSLTQASMATLEAAEKVDPDLVWFAMKNYGGSEPLTAPHTDLRPVYFPKSILLLKRHL